MRILDDYDWLKRIRLFAALVYLGLAAYLVLPELYDTFVTVRSLTTGVGGRSIFDPIAPPTRWAGVLHYAQVIVATAALIIWYLAWGRMRAMRAESSTDED